MSGRFGRNKRRAARQAIAGLQKSLVNSHIHVAQQDEALSRLRREMDDARRIAGEMSVLFPARRVVVSGPRRNSIQVRSALQFLSSEYISDRAEMQLSAARDQNLSVLLHQIDTSALRDAVHVRVHFGEQTMGYAISESAIQSTPPRVLTERVIRELSRSLSDQLHSTLKDF